MTDRGNILIVDDSAGAREALEGTLVSGGYNLDFAENGPAALTRAASNRPDLVLLDVMMPQMDGFEVCRRLRQSPTLAEVPIIMITALDDRGARIKGIEAGADDFLSKPIDRVELRARVRTVIRLNRYRRLLSERAKVERLITLSPDGILVVDGRGTILLANDAIHHLLGLDMPSALLGKSLWTFVTDDARDQLATDVSNVIATRLPAVCFESALRPPTGDVIPTEIACGFCEWDDEPTCELIVRDITERKHHEAEILRLNDELLTSYDATLEGWVRALDLRDHETEGHTQRVTETTMRLARAMGLSDDTLEHMRRGALLHDIGKMGIPDAILRKPGPLDKDERRIMERHPRLAYDMLSHIEFLRPALDIPLHHHERWDGSGYPDRLAGHEIPFAARIFSVVDVWDALCSDRPYRTGWPEERTREHIVSLSGKSFDPQVVDAFWHLAV